MIKELRLEAEKTHTENGGAAYSTSGNAVLDLFSSIGGMRQAGKNKIIGMFEKAFAEDPTTALRTVFFARDVRAGLGERKIFRTIMRYLAENYPEIAIKNLPLIPEYGRFDDLLSLLCTPCEAATITYIKKQLESDRLNPAPSLLAKWLPSINASSIETKAYASYLAEKLGMNQAEYRKTLSALRAKIDILERHLTTKEYDFDYSKQPSYAMAKYRQAFLRQDRERYLQFLDDVKCGKKTMHANVLYPYDVVRKCINGNLDKEERKNLDVTWNTLKSGLRTTHRALAVVDGSGSMYYGGCNPQPIEVALSLGILFAETNEGEFHNTFITFSQNPKLVTLKGKDIYKRVHAAMTYNECANTNLEKVFSLLLKTAVKHKLPQSEFPEYLYIISDMEFDKCTNHSDLTVFENAKEQFTKHGYALPKIIFWKVSARSEQVPVQQNEQGVCLMSGASANLFKLSVKGNIDPLTYMREVLTSERYLAVSA